VSEPRKPACEGGVALLARPSEQGVVGFLHGSRVMIGSS